MSSPETTQFVVDGGRWNVKAKKLVECGCSALVPNIMCVIVYAVVIDVVGGAGRKAVGIKLGRGIRKSFAGRVVS